MAGSENDSTDAVEASVEPASIQAALDGLKAEELGSLAEGLARSHAGMEQTLEDLRLEQAQLKEDNYQLHSTIEFMMRELQKLNIGADNLVEPQLLEGPLDFVGRFWEKVRPRTSAMLISEHVGEIKKPGAEEMLPPQLLGERLGQLHAMLAERFRSTQSVAGLQDEDLQAGDEASAQAAAELQKHIAKHGKELGRRISGALSFLSQAAANAGDGQKEVPAADGQAASTGKRRTKGKKGKRRAKSEVDESSEGLAVLPEIDWDPRAPVASAPANEQPENETKNGSKDKPFLGGLLNYLLLPGQAPEVGPSSRGPDSPGGGERTAQADHAEAGTAAQTGVENYFKNLRLKLQGGSKGAEVKSASEPAPAPAPAAPVSPLAAGGSEAAAASSRPAVHEVPEGIIVPVPIQAPEPAPTPAPEPAPTTAPCPPREELVEQEREEEEEDNMHATVLIVANLKLDDGSIETLKVSASDRVKVVVKKFIREHSLKSWFEEPLRAYLSQAEADAEKFPVHLDGDLMEIREQYSKKAA